jgi:outer membrane protein, heavy metal efflux system
LKRIFFLLLISLFSVQTALVFAQQNVLTDTIQFSRNEAETMFLQQNVSLISENLNIDKAEAQVIQARLWPNPVFSIDEVNFWTTTSGTNNESYFGEELPPLIGDFGRSRHFAIQLEQLVQTAGKRKKMIAMEQVTVDMAETYYKDLLRNLKIEFRNSLTELQYLQFFASTFEGQIKSIQSLVSAYKNQLDQGNISKGEYIRLKALEFELLSEINELEKETNTIQKELKILMNLPSNSYLKIREEGFIQDTERMQNYNLIELQEMALQSRPDLNALQLEESFYAKSYAYERAQRTPDLNFSVGYDRGGNFLLDFIGFGLSFDFPMFDRNRGNIKYAQIGMEQSELLTNQKRNQVQLEVENAYRNFIATRNLYENIDQEYENDLELLLNSYTRNFRERNISMLEYMDFLDAYLENKKIILQTRKQLQKSYEEIQYITGKEL